MPRNSTPGGRRGQAGMRGDRGDDSSPGRASSERTCHSEGLRLDGSRGIRSLSAGRAAGSSSPGETKLLGMTGLQAPLMAGSEAFGGLVDRAAGLSCPQTTPVPGNPERHRHGSRRSLLPARRAPPGRDGEGPRRHRLLLARRLERCPLHVLRRRPGRALRADSALRALVPARRTAPPPAARSREEAPPRPPRAGGLLVRAGRRDRPLLAGGLPLRGGGLGRGRMEGARTS